jgi:hypothetical protein
MTNRQRARYLLSHLNHLNERIIEARNKVWPQVSVEGLHGYRSLNVARKDTLEYRLYTSLTDLHFIATRNMGRVNKVRYTSEELDQVERILTDLEQSFARLTM